MVGLIRSRLTADKLCLVNPRSITGPSKMSLLLEVKSTLWSSVKSNSCCDYDDLDWHVTSNQQGQTLFRTSTGLFKAQMIRQGRLCIVPQNVFQLTLCFGFSFRETQVWNNLNHRNDLGQRRVIRVTYGCYNCNPYYRSIASVIRRSSVPRVRVGPTTRHTLAQSMAETPWKFTVVAHHCA